MKKWPLRILAILLVVSLGIAAITTILNSTVLNSQYIESRFAAVDGYNRLSSELSNQIAQQVGLASVPGVTATIRNILNSGLVQQKVNTVLNELENYYQGKGPAPTIDFSDLGSQAGLSLKQNSDLLRPITIGPGDNNANRQAVMSLNTARKIAVPVSIVLVLLLLVLSIIWRYYTILPNVLIGAGIILGIVAIVAYIGSGEVKHYITLSHGSSTFTTLGQDLARNIGKDLAHRFGVIAVICLVLGIVTRLWTGRLQRRHLSSSDGVVVQPQSGLPLDETV